MASNVNTRFLVFSDTHGEDFKHKINQKADVAIHCGDLTEESKLDEFKQALEMLKRIDAPLTLVIAGNHDFTMDTLAFKNNIFNSSLTDDQELVEKVYGKPGEARQLFESEDAKLAGIVFLDEGTHHFTLANGASLTVYASPYTPCKAESGWGFQYLERDDHEWKIGSEVDIAITHSPPKGVLDYTDARERAGSQSLFASIARAQPRMHCYGHIHEGWGAKRVAWRDEISENPTHFTDIDNDQSEVVESLSTINIKKFDEPDIIDAKKERLAKLKEKGHCAADMPLERDLQTLFVNAAIEGADGEQQLPWIVEIELPRSVDQKEDRKRKRDEYVDGSYLQAEVSSEEGVRKRSRLETD